MQSSVKIKPAGDYILCSLFHYKEQTSGLILLNNQNSGAVKMAKVIDVGERVKEDMRNQHVNIKKDDILLLSTIGLIEEYNNQHYIFVKLCNVCGVVER